MLKYLIKSAIETYKADGLKILIEQTLRYIGLYGNPFMIMKYWLARFSGHRWAVVNVQGSKMRLSLKDKGIHSDLYINKIREPEATRYLQSIMKPDWTIVDIGANIGYYALMEARKVKEVIAIEAGKFNYNNLLHNIKINRYDNIKVNHLAVGDKNEVVSFHISKACNWNRIASGNDSEDEKVQMVTLDSFIDGKHVDFVRMDVEGYEMNILKGMDNILKTSRPDMFIEVHRDFLRDYGGSQLEFMEFLAGYDYSIKKSFVSARPSVTGKIRDLLDKHETRILITERGIASHIFFGV